MNWHRTNAAIAGEYLSEYTVSVSEWNTFSLTNIMKPGRGDRGPLSR